MASGKTNSDLGFPFPCALPSSRRLVRGFAQNDDEMFERRLLSPCWPGSPQILRNAFSRLRTVCGFQYSTSKKAGSLSIFSYFRRIIDVPNQ